MIQTYKVILIEKLIHERKVALVQQGIVPLNKPPAQLFDPCFQANKKNIQSTLLLKN
jgi:hypothetical protein